MAMLQRCVAESRVVSLGDVRGEAERFNYRLALFIPVDYKAIAKVGGREYELITVRKAGSNKAYFQVHYVWKHQTCS